MRNRGLLLPIFGTFFIHVTLLTHSALVKTENIYAGLILQLGGCIKSNNIHLSTFEKILKLPTAFEKAEKGARDI